MRLSAWRITKQKHAPTAFTGKGAKAYGGRWNNPGTSLVYTAQSQALATLEILVHLESSDLLQQYILIEVTFDEALVIEIDRGTLPLNWMADPPPERIRAIGDKWARTKRSPVLRVPSALVPDEHNYLLNPTHPDFPQIQLGKPIRYKLDPRLMK